MQIQQRTITPDFYNVDKITQTEVDSCTSAKTLFYYMYHYDWDKGFAIPRIIVDNPYCDMATALLAFHRADGYGIFEEKQFYHSEWANFVYRLYARIVNEDFKEAYYAYRPISSQEMLTALQEISPDMDDIFINGTKGNEIDFI